jgi:DedD protein
MADTEDVDTLKRRGRRRLVGAIALVLAAVIVLPMVFDREPKQAPVSVNIRIPGEDVGTFAPNVYPKSAPAAPAGPKEEVPPAAPPQPAGKSEPTPASASDRERDRTSAAPVKAEFVIPVVALSSAERVRSLTARLAAAKIPHYTEPVSTASGRVTRVRAGPFDSRDAAERARAQLERLGLKPGSVTQRSE